MFDVKDRPRRIWLSLLRGLKPSSRSSKSSEQELHKRTVKFSESVAHFHYYKADSTFSDSISTQCNDGTSESSHPEAPADAIIFDNTGLKPLCHMPPLTQPTMKSNGAAGAPQTTMTRDRAVKVVAREVTDGVANGVLGGAAGAATNRSMLKGEQVANRSRKPNQPKAFAPLRDLFDLQTRTRRLLESFVLTDPRVRVGAVYAMTKDLLPEDLSEREVLLFEDDLNIRSTKVISYPGPKEQQSRALLLQRQMVEWGTGKPSYSCFAQADVTKLSKFAGIEDPDEDLFLTIACEIMLRLADREGYDTRWLPEIPESYEMYWIRGLEALLAFHELFFILEHPELSTSSIRMTHVSKRFLDTEKSYLTGLEFLFHADRFNLAKMMEKKVKFFFDARPDNKGPQQLVCCVPLFGPDIASWICFLVSGPVFERSAGFI